MSTTELYREILLVVPDCARQRDFKKLEELSLREQVGKQGGAVQDHILSLLSCHE